MTLVETELRTKLELNDYQRKLLERLVKEYVDRLEVHVPNSDQRITDIRDLLARLRNFRS